MVGPGYDDRQRSMPPFMWVEKYERIGPLAVLAFGAYNAFGLIGPEKGGVAVVLEEPEKAVVATKDFPYDPFARASEFKKLTKALRPGAKDWQPEEKGFHLPPKAVREILEKRGYDVR